MTNKKSTKRALLVSAMAMVICFTMLLGTTFAWFTDFEESTGNVITAGKLEIKFEYKDNLDSTYSNAEGAQIFTYTNWEPGYAAIKQVKVTNDGTLAFNYKFKITGATSAIADAIDVYCFKADSVARGDLNRGNAAYLGTLTTVLGANFDFAEGETLEETESQVYTIVLKMNEEAGNEYQLATTGAFSVQVLATQKTASETDSIDGNYDKHPEDAFPGQNTVPSNP